LNGISNVQGTYNRLTEFKRDPATYPLAAEEQKKTFIKDYVVYWQYLFDTLKDQNKTNLSDLENEINGIKNVLNPKPVIKRLEPKAAPLIVVAPPPPRVGDAPVLSRGLTIPTNLALRGHTLEAMTSLREVTKGFITGERSPNCWYGQVKEDSGSFTSALVNEVHENFYWIMKDAGKLGPVKGDGHSTEADWGKNVFLTGKSGDVIPPDVTPAALNQYRLRAMLEVLNGKIRNGDKLFPGLALAV
jgi:hypothetical protein